MPRKKFDKATSTTFHLVHRPQNDPRLHDAASSSMVLQEITPPQSQKIKNRHALESELFHDTSSKEPPKIRDNEGEAAEHGIYYDDTEYDYMQHIRDLNAGSGDGESFFVEARVGSQEKKGKGKMSLEEALRKSSLQEQQSENGISRAESLFGGDILASKEFRQTSYQAQQDVPDALAGFQPDMDPRLREVLEALDDDAYVDDVEEFFGEIAQDGEEVSLKEFEETEFAEEESVEEDGWESDTTEKPSKEYKTDTSIPPFPATDTAIPDAPAFASDNGDGNWMKEYSKFKADQNPISKPPKPVRTPADIQSSILTGATTFTTGRRKKRKGAMTSSTGYSMTSSSLARTEGQTLLDARFDKIEEEYADEDGDVDMDMDNDAASTFSKGSMASKMSNFPQASNLSRASNMSAMSMTSSQAPTLTSPGFESIMDEFLGGYSMSGKKRVRKGGYQSGIEQLDELRRELGPAKVQDRLGKV
ncbi:MAG: hypothetical protein Q9217_003142 [Psora testacea]